MVWSTDQVTLNWIVEEVREHIPTCATRNERFSPLINDRLMGFELHKLNNSDEEVGAWLILRLFEEGWYTDSPSSNLMDRLSSKNSLDQYWIDLKKEA